MGLSIRDGGPHGGGYLGVDGNPGVCGSPEVGVTPDSHSGDGGSGTAPERCVAVRTKKKKVGE